MDELSLKDRFEKEIERRWSSIKWHSQPQKSIYPWANYEGWGASVILKDSLIAYVESPTLHELLTKAEALTKEKS